MTDLGNEDLDGIEANFVRAAHLARLIAQCRQAVELDAVNEMLTAQMREMRQQWRAQQCESREKIRDLRNRIDRLQERFDRR